MDARLIIDGPARGSWNMAVDEALFAQADEAAPVLRLYRWSEPTLSLGYFQRADARHAHTPSQHLALVRRSTGGGAIVHDRELTYSLVLLLPDERPAAARALMCTVHRSLVQTLADLGTTIDQCSVSTSSGVDDPFLCFQRHTPGDLVLKSHKVVGSAQRRQRHALLQHGSILLERSPAAPELPGINDLAERPCTVEQLMAYWPQQLSAALEVAWTPSAVSARESELAAAVEREKFAADRWNRKR